MQRLTVTITKGHIKALHRGAAKYEISVSEYLRRLLDSYMALHGGHGRGMVDDDDDTERSKTVLLDVG